MPAEGKNNLKEKARRLPLKPGVYLMRDRLGTILYVGKAKNLKRRVSSYFQPSRKRKIEQPKVAAMIDLIYDFEVIELNSDTEAILLEGRLIKEWKPKYNTLFVDDKRFLLLRVDIRSNMPKFRLVRNRREDGALYFGPFTQASALKQTLVEMRQKFGILLSDAQPKRLEDGSYILYDDMRAEIYGHANQVSEAAYHERVSEALAFFEGKAKEWLEQLERKMQQAAKAKRYEEAAKLRDRVQALRATMERKRTFSGHALPMTSDDATVALEALSEALGLDHSPARMECFDISHISGTFVVASMVHFRNGKPDKSQYRRFRIKSFMGNDDYKAMEEVVGRRYQRLHDEKKPFPDLIVIDGGAGQVTAALKAFMAAGLELPPIIGLAKKRETIIFANGREPLNLPESHQALRLLQRLRDEAHRFANAYNAEWRSRKIRESILDDFSGLGAKRKAALLAHFKDMASLRKASPEQLQAVEGMGPKLSEALHLYLKQNQ